MKLLMIDGAKSSYWPADANEQPVAAAAGQPTDEPSIALARERVSNNQGTVFNIILLCEVAAPYSAPGALHVL